MTEKTVLFLEMIAMRIEIKTSKVVIKTSNFEPLAVCEMIQIAALHA